MRARSQAEDQDSRLLVTEGRNRLPPVDPFAVSLTFRPRDLLAILPESWASIAMHDFLVE
jgi:hypothetical protein